MRSIILAAAIWLTSCVYFTSWGDVMGSWVGAPISEYVQLKGEPDEKWVRKDGKTIYKYHMRKLDPSCIHYWVVDEQAIIEGFYYEGNCRPVG